MVGGARLFVLARLSQIGTVAGTVERHLSLLTATLRTNASVHGGAKALLFSDFADCTTQNLGAPV